MSISSNSEIYSDNIGRSDRPSAVMLFMWLLPHFAIPGVAVYRPPAASLFLVIWICFALMRPQTVSLRLSTTGRFRCWMALFLLYCLVSAAYGYWNLESLGKLNLALSYSNIEYHQVVTDRLLQIILVFTAFEIVRHCRHSLRTLMCWWLQGMTAAVFLHILAYAFNLSDSMQRAGTFNEGNLAGLYYLLSIFVALEYKRLTYDRLLSNLFICSAFVGVLLSRSTAGILLLVVLFIIQYLLSSHNLGKLLTRFILLSAILPLFGAGIAAEGFDFGIREKLFEEEVTAQSFSRIDRLESINAAISLFSKEPLFGHGLQTYGFLSNELLTGPLQATYDGSFRRIPNNIYAELAAELGMIGLMLFFCLMVSLIRLAAMHTGAGRIYWLLGLTGLLLYWNAFPTYSVLFIWVFFGLILKSAQSSMPAPPLPIS